LISLQAHKLSAMKKNLIAAYAATIQLISFAAFSVPAIDKYNLKFNFDFKEQKVFCKAELSLNNIQQSDTINLLLYRLLKVKSIKDDLGNDIKFNQDVVSFSDWEALQVNYVSVFVNKVRPGHIEQKIIVDYEGLLLGYTETGMSYVKDNIDAAFTLLRMDCFAYPVQGTISWEKNRASGLSYFDYTISVTVPDSLSVVNGGQLISKNKTNGFTEFIFQNLKPAWRIDIAIGKYSTLNENGFSIYYFPCDSSGAKNVSESVAKTYSLFNNWFGEVPFSGYSIIEIPNDWGSQTDVTCIIQEASAFKDRNKLYELYHEISHIWNVTSIDKSPCRLESEGFAMFLQYLVTEKIDHKIGLLDSAANKIFENLKRKFASDSVASNTAIIDYGRKQLTDLSYTKGMLFFYILYRNVGENVFMKTLNGYYKLYRNKGATTEDFLKYLQTELNTKKTEKLINDWILTSKSSKTILFSKSIENLAEKY
jgi:hypothetical protein